MNVKRTPPREIQSRSQDRIVPMNETVKKKGNPAVAGARFKAGETYKLDEMERTGEDKCGKCKKSVSDTDSAAECDICKCWFHLACGGLSEKVYNLMCKAGNIDWYCQTCKQEVLVLRQENSKLKEENKLLRERLAAIESKVELIKEEIKQEILGEINKKIEILFDNGKEQEEKKMRENNLVLYNAEESTKSEPQDRESEDEAFCRKLINDGVKMNDFSITRVIRLGRPRDDRKPRPLLVKLENSKQKWNILRNAKNLRNCSEIMRKVIITPDKTIKERETDKLLRDELKKKREKGENNWFIKNGQLVKRNFQ